MSQPPIVEIDRVSFGYDPARPVLHDVTVRMPQGKVFAIMGQSGCGKTTLLRIIGGALRPTSGAARVLGSDVASLDTGELYALRRKMGMLFQFGALFTDLSVYDNVAFPLREHTDLPAGVIRDLVLLKLEAVGLRGAANLRPSELSGGMARRVALARAIALDPISLGVVARLIRRLNDSLGATSIVVTHDVAETLPFVDHVFFMADGRVVAEGPPPEVVRAQVPFVTQFVQGSVDGAVPFHFPAPAYSADLGIGAKA